MYAFLLQQRGPPILLISITAPLVCAIFSPYISPLVTGVILFITDKAAPTPVTAPQTPQPPHIPAGIFIVRLARESRA